MLAACFASSAGRWNVGRTATINSIRSVTAASAAAVDHASSEGASTPLMSLRLSSAISVRSKPICSLRCASFFTYAQLTSIFSFSTLRLSDEEVREPGVGIEADDAHRIGYEIRKRVHVIIELPPGAVVDDVLDSANLDAGKFHDALHVFDHLHRWFVAFHFRSAFRRV